uniref:Uncharacterized protein n=1 Tax=Anopheles atroparvus TaxID=41427 RepID=A0A182J5Q3_ANOAO
MDENNICAPKVPISPFCRICIAIKDVNYNIHETISDGSRAISLHMMLAKLFPAVFNDEQVQNDGIMSWPDRVCEECKHTVAMAYHLYELCVASAERLEKLLAVEEVVLDETEKKISVEMEVEEEEEENQLVTTFSKQSVPKFKAESTRSIGFLKKRARKNHKGNGPSQLASMKQEPLGIAYQTKALVETAVEIGSADSVHDSIDAAQSPVPSEDSAKVKSEVSEAQLTASCPTVETTETNGPEPKRRKKTRESSRVSKIKSEKRTKPASDNVDRIDEDPARTGEPQTKIDLYRCQLCEGPTYTSPTELTNHLKKDHPDQISCCDKCPKVFMSEPAFQHHQYCHAIGRSHFCMFCDKGFITEELLKGHVRTHTHRTDYLCFLCGKEFSNSSNLRQHVKRHYGEKPFACDQCPMRFSTKGYLTRHQQTHTKVKKFACDTCGSLFSRQYTLVKHQLLHTGARYFSCEVCKMSFTSSDHVKRHMRTHTGEKPYKCGCCGRAFAQSNDMVKHMRTHLGDNAYQCDRCEASYRLLSELRNHYKEHYLPGDNPNGSVEEENEIRFTSMNILNRQFHKKP